MFNLVDVITDEVIAVCKSMTTIMMIDGMYNGLTCVKWVG